MSRTAIMWFAKQFRSPKSLIQIGIMTTAVGAIALSVWQWLVVDKNRAFAQGIWDLSADAMRQSGKLVLLSDTTHNFGVMDQERTESHIFEIQNEGPGDLVLELLDKSCGCTSVKVNGHAMDVNRGELLAPPPLPPIAGGPMPQGPASSSPGFIPPLADSIPLPPGLQQMDIAVFMPTMPPHPVALPDPAGQNPSEAGTVDAPVMLRPGERAAVELTWSTRLNSGAIRQFVRMGTSDRTRPFVDFSIEGEVIPVVRLSENPIRIMNARSTESSRATFRVFSEVSGKLNPSLLTSSSPLVSARFEPLPDEDRMSINAKSGYLGTIQVAPGLPVGPFHAELAIATNMPERPELRVAVFGQIEGDVVLVPSDQLDFQMVSQDKPRTRTLLAKLRGDTSESLRVVHLAPDFLKFELHTAKTGNGGNKLAIVEVTVPAGAPVGPFEGMIELKGIGDSATHVMIPVRGQVTE